MRRKHLRILLILGFALLLALGYVSAVADSSHTIANDGNWSGTLTQLNWKRMDGTRYVSLDWDHPIYTLPFPLSFIKIPGVKAGIKLTTSASGEFDITISRANLSDDQSVNIDSAIRYKGESGLIPGREIYRERIDEGGALNYVPPAGSHTPIMCGKRKFPTAPQNIRKRRRMNRGM